VDGVIIFAIENLAGELVGGISLHSRSPKNGTFSFGVGIYANHRKNGYAEDATRIMLRYGYLERRFQKCNSACTHNNHASIRLHKKLGFLEEGRRRRQVYMNGQFYDEILFGLTCEEFERKNHLKGAS
jgi:RimJ/RimL family protein N-acetyltransferase